MKEFISRIDPRERSEPALDLWNSFSSTEQERLRNLFDALSERGPTNGDGNRGAPPKQALQKKQRIVGNEPPATSRFRRNQAKGTSLQEEDDGS
jgi:hypothetical protein